MAEKGGCEIVLTAENTPFDMGMKHHIQPNMGWMCV